MGVTGPWDLELGLELGADDGVERVIVDVQLGGVLAPWAPPLLRSKASRLPERPFQRGQHVQREGQGRASGPIDIP